MMEVLVFDTLEPRWMPVKIGRDCFILREPSEAASCEWQNNNVRNAKYQDGKVVGVGNLADGQPMLVSACLFYVDNPLDPEESWRPRKRDNRDENVPLSVIRSWRSSIVSMMFDKCKEMGDLGGKKDNEYRDLLTKAVEQEDPPGGITSYTFREWITNLAKSKPEYTPLTDLVEDVEQERAKN